jgi:DNA-binding protein H-NS
VPYYKIIVPKLFGGDGMNRKTLEAMSVERLWRLHEQITEILTEKINAEKFELNQRLQRLRRGTMEEPIADGLGIVASRRPYPRVLPKYSNPSDPSQTWSGRGKMPRWLKTQMEFGKTVDDFRIKSK